MRGLADFLSSKLKGVLFRSGVGYFVGAAAITFNYYFALGVLLFLILLSLPWAITGGGSCGPKGGG